jgi:hypothetical protein
MTTDPNTIATGSVGTPGNPAIVEDNAVPAEK